MGTHGTFLGDVDGDGKADLFALGDVYVGVRRGTGDPVGLPLFGNYESWRSEAFFGNHDTLLADVIGDGKADLVAFFDGNVQVMVSTGTEFGAAQR